LKREEEEEEGLASKKGKRKKMVSDGIGDRPAAAAAAAAVVVSSLDDHERPAEKKHLHLAHLHVVTAESESVAPGKQAALVAAIAAVAGRRFRAALCRRGRKLAHRLFAGF